jgi:carboxyl-terminal processing protease
MLMPITADQTEAIKLTIAKYYLPSGRTIQAKGVKPDIVAYTGDVPKKEDDFSLKEKDLKKHLEVELEKVDGKKEKEVESEDDNSSKVITEEEIYKDNQLKTALDILRALILTN